MNILGNNKRFTIHVIGVPKETIKSVEQKRKTKNLNK